MLHGEPNGAEADQAVSSLTEFLHNAIDYLPGPKDPNQSQFQRGKQAKRGDDPAKNRKARASVSSNPQRSDKRKQRRKTGKKEYDLVQWEYHNQRRKVVRKIMGSALKSNPVTMDGL